MSSQQQEQSPEFEAFSRHYQPLMRQAMLNSNGAATHMRFGQMDVRGLCMHAEGYTEEPHVRILRLLGPEVIGNLLPPSTYIMALGGDSASLAVGSNVRVCINRHTFEVSLHEEGRSFVLVTLELPSEVIQQQQQQLQQNPPTNGGTYSQNEEPR